MDRIKAIIVDDEEAARNVLQHLLHLECPSVEVLAMCTDVSQAVEAIQQWQPDLVFLDIEMPGYAGYELFDFVAEVNFEIIFVTAFDQYAIKAFELSAIDYLVKPINRKRLLQAVEKLQEKLTEQKTIAQYHILKQSLAEKSIEHIVVSEVGQQTIIKFADIIAMEAEGAYSRIHLQNAKLITVSKNIKHFENLLSENRSFFRCHKSWIINLSHMLNYSKINLTLRLTGGIVAKLSKYRKDEFDDILRF